MVCSLCCENIHENNIKEAKIGLEKDHRQKFTMDMEQFNRISSEEAYTNDEEPTYSSELHKHLSKK